MNFSKTFTLKARKHHNRNVLLTALSVCSGIVLLLGTAQSALSETITVPNAAALGMQSYEKKDYKTAKTQLEIAANQFPTSAHIQYILGNSCFQLRDNAGAVKAYQACLNAHPNATLTGYCQKMLTHLHAAPAGAGAATAPATDATKGKDDSAEKTAKTEGAEDPIQAKISAHKKAVMAQAQEEVSRVRKDADRQIAELEANGNQWTRYTDDNTIRPTISKEERQNINNETDQKVHLIMDNAKRRANAINSP